MSVEEKAEWLIELGKRTVEAVKYNGCIIFDKTDLIEMLESEVQE